MRTQQKENPVIGSLSVCTKPSANDAKYEDMWRHYEPKVRKMAGQYYVPGAVGAELDDLIQIAQALLLHALRKYDPTRTRTVVTDGVSATKSVESSTYYYTCLKNEYKHLYTRCFPKKQFVVVSVDPATGDKQITKCAGKDIEKVLFALGNDGRTYSVITKMPNSKFACLDSMRSLDRVNENSETLENKEDVSLLSNLLSSTTRDPLEQSSYEDIIERVNNSIPDPVLRQITVWLFEGHKMSGPDGVLKRSGLRKHQVDRAMHRIRMLLAGEFGMSMGRAG